MSKENTASSNESEASDENVEEEQCESYVLTLTQKPGNEDECIADENNINTSQCFEECSKVFLNEGVNFYIYLISYLCCWKYSF